MDSNTQILGLLKKDPIASKDDTFNIETMLNENWDKVENGVRSVSKFPKSTGTTKLVVTTGIFNLIDGQSFTIIPTGNNGGSPTTINADGKGEKSLYKQLTTDPPNITNGKPITVWYDLASDCFFLKASAEGTAEAHHVLAPYPFSNDNDTGIIGTMANIGSVGTQNLTTEGDEYVIPAGYHNGLGKVKAVIAGIAASIIRAGSSIGGIVGTYTSDATAGAANILAPLSAYINGTKVTGTMVNRGSVGTQNLTTEGAEYTIAQGYHNGVGKVKAVISGLVASVIKAGTTVGGIVGTFTSDADAVAADILAPKSGYVNGVKITGAMINRAGDTASTNLTRSGTTLKLRASVGYRDGSNDYVTHTDANDVAANIKKDVSIRGITGTLEGNFTESEMQPMATIGTATTVRISKTGSGVLTGVKRLAIGSDNVDARIEVDGVDLGSFTMSQSANTEQAFAIPFSTSLKIKSVYTQAFAASFCMGTRFMGKGGVSIDKYNYNNPVTGASLRQSVTGKGVINYLKLTGIVVIDGITVWDAATQLYLHAPNLRFESSFEIWSIYAFGISNSAGYLLD